jgi:hypothetical protein
VGSELLFEDLGALNEAASSLEEPAMRWCITHEGRRVVVVDVGWLRLRRLRTPSQRRRPL